MMRYFHVKDINKAIDAILRGYKKEHLFIVSNV